MVGPCVVADSRPPPPEKREFTPLFALPQTPWGLVDQRVYRSARATRISFQFARVCVSLTARGG